MTFNPAIPQPGDFLADSQQDILDNFSTSNTSFGKDHYPFDDLTANNGLHKKVSTPIIPGSVHPVIDPGEPQFYAMQDTGPDPLKLGVLQYSRGYNNSTASSAAPSPVTSIHSPTTPLALAGGGTLNVLDFTGITMAYGFIFCKDTAAPNVGVGAFYITFNGTIGTVQEIAPPAGLTVVLGPDKMLKINNNSIPVTNYTNLYWTVHLYRINT